MSEKVCDKLLPARQLTIAKKNRPGTRAADFAYITREGQRRTLYVTRTGSSRMLLIFYDPDCDHCTEILSSLYDNALISTLVDADSLYVLAVYTEGNRELWDSTKYDMPLQWHVACDLSGIVDNELYAIPAMPVVYLLDADKKVILKDPFPEELESALSND